MEKEFLTAQELAEKLRVTVDTVWRYTRSGRIPCLRISPRDYRYELRAVLDALAAGGAARSAPPGADSEPTALKPADPDRLRAFAGEPPEGPP